MPRYLNLMIKSMIRELKRRNSFKAHILNKEKNYLSKNALYSSENNHRQTKIFEFLYEKIN